MILPNILRNPVRSIDKSNNELLVCFCMRSLRLNKTNVLSQNYIENKHVVEYQASQSKYCPYATVVVGQMHSSHVIIFTSSVVISSILLNLTL